MPNENGGDGSKHDEPDAVTDILNAGTELEDVDTDEECFHKYNYFNKEHSIDIVCSPCGPKECPSTWSIEENVACGIEAVKKVRRNRMRKERKKLNKIKEAKLNIIKEAPVINSTPKEIFHDNVKKTLATLTRIKDESEAKHIGALGGSEKKWIPLAIAIDSGACDSVIDPSQVPANLVLETYGSRNGDDYQSATGETIANLGELRLGLVTREMSVRGMTFTGAPVAKPLGSVKRLCMAGHTVVFDNEYLYIYNKETGELNQIREDEGNYMLDVWVAPPGSEEYDSLPFGRQAP